mgnify:CR=1 FL=1
MITLGLVATVLLVLVYAVIQINTIKTYFPKPILLEDLLNKLTTHPELKQYKNIKPVNVIQVTSQNLNELSTGIPGLDQSYIGNIVVVFDDRLAVYDYNNDIIKVNFPIAKAAPNKNLRTNSSSATN